MHKHPHSFGTIEDLRASGGKTIPSFARLPSDERAAMIGTILDHFEYGHLNREDKGLVRVFLQEASGYSRAQVARYIAAHQQTVQYVTPAVVSSVMTMQWKKMLPLGAVTLLLLLSGAINRDTTGDVLSVLNAERTEQGSGPSRTLVVQTVNDEGLTPLLAVHQETVENGERETLVTWSLSDLLRRVEARRIARLRPSADHGTSTEQVLRPDIGIEREAFPAYDETNVHAAANDPWDVPASGAEGQILMIRDGKPVWRDFPYLDQIRTEAPHGTEATTRAGGSRRGGSGGGSSSTTTIVQQTTAVEPSGWTDGAGVVYLTDNTDSVGIGTATPETKLEVLGAISGASLYIGGSLSGTSLYISDSIISNSIITGALTGSSLHINNSITSSSIITGALTGSSLYIDTIAGAGLTSCNSTNSKLVWNAATKQFECAVDQTVGTGLSQATGDERYVKKQGDTMTGTLTINVTGGLQNTIGLRVMNALSGAVIHAEKSLTTSGTLVFEGAASGSSLYIASSIQGAGLADCDLSTQKLQWDASTGRFTCGTDLDVSTWSNTGALQNRFDTRYVNTSGDSMTGTLTVNITNGVSNTIGLKLINALSGAVIHAEKSLTTSGTLVFEGAGSGSSLYIASSLQGAGLVDCDIAGTSKLLWDSSTGRFSCGTDTDTNTTYTAARGLTLNGTAFSLNSTITGALVNFTTVSGSIIRAKTSLNSSGSLTWEGAASGASLYVASSLQGIGLTDCDAANQTLNWDASTGRFSCGTDSDTTYQAGQGLNLSVGNVLTLNSTITGALVRFTTISGSIITAKNSLASSGSLTWEGAASGATLWVSSFDGAGLTDCDLSTNKLIWDATTKRFSCSTDQNTTAWSNTGSLQLRFDNRYLRTAGGTLTGSLVLRSTLSGASLLTLSNYHGCTLKTTSTGAVICSTDIDTNTTYQAGQGLTLNGTFFSLNASLTGSSLRFQTVSGSVVRTNSLNSSGSLTWEGAASGATLWVSSFDGAGLTDCDLSTNKLIWDATAKRFSCATDLNTGSSYFAGQGLSLSAGNAFSLNSTITGALVSFTTVSGSTLYAKNQLASSGTLVTESGAYFDGTTMVIQAGNNRVGIGTASPVDLLTLRASAPSLTLQSSLSSQQWKLLNTGASGYFQIFDTTNNRPVFAADNSTGNISMGTGATATNSRLYVWGGGNGANIDVRGDPRVVGGDQATVELEGNDYDVIPNSIRMTYYGKDHGVGTTMGFLNNKLGVLEWQGINTALINVNATKPLIIGTNNTERMRITETGSVGIGTTTPHATLDVLGSVSGSTLTLSSLKGCDTIDTDANGNLVCGSDASGGGSGSPEVGTASFTGAVVRLGNTQWVKKSGDTMTGTLTVNITNGVSNTIGLKLINALSGAVIHAEKSLTTSGTLVFEGAASGSSLYVASSLQGVGLTDCDAANQTLAWDASTGRFSCGTDADTTYQAGQGLTLNGAALSLNTTITGALVRFTTISGSIITAKNSLASSGSLTWEGAASGATLWVSSFDGAGLVDCDAATQTLAWDATTKRFSCGTDSDTTYQAGQGLILNGTAFSLNSTITGALVQFTTVSGSTIYAKSALNASGSLSVEGTTLLEGTSIFGDTASDTIIFVGVVNSNIVPSAADVSDIGSSVSYWKDLFVKNGSFKNLASGALLHAEKSLSTSGSLTWEGAASGATLWVSSFDGAGLTDCDLSTNKLIWDATTKRFSCSTDQNTTAWSNTGSLQLRFDNRYLRTAGGTLTGSLVLRSTLSGASLLTLSNYHGCTLKTTSTGAVICSTDIDTNTTYQAGQGLTLNGTFFSLNASLTGSSLRFQTVSGSVVRTNSLNSSGSLTWEGAASGATLWVSSFDGAGLTDCDLSTNKLIWDATAKRFSCATDLNTGSSYFAGQGLSLSAGNAFSLNSTITGALVRFTTISGSTIYAKNLLTSSGTLTTESGAYFDGNTLVIAAGPNRVGIRIANPKTALEVGDTISGALITQNGAGNNYFLGNLGIGTSSAAMGKLEVLKNSTYNVENTAGFALNVGLNGEPELVMGTDSGNTISYIQSLLKGISYGGAPLILQPNAGNVGIGTIGAGSRLSVSGAILVNPRGNIDGTSADTGLALEAIGTISGSLITQNGLGSNYFLGNVGIGTTTPNLGGQANNAGLLTIQNAPGTTLHGVIELANRTDAQDQPVGSLDWIAPTQTNAADVKVAAIDTWLTGTTANNRGSALLFYTRADGNGNVVQERMRISQYGNVGIGTHGVDAKLEVAGSISGSLITLNGTGTSYLLGKVGVGTKTPGSKLSVSGSVIIGNNIGSNAAKAQLDVKGTMSGALLTLSSMRNCTLKTSGSGNVICGTDNTGGAGSNWSSTGSLYTYFNTQYVKKSGDTMTGALTINLLSHDTSHIIFGYQGNFDTSLSRRSAGVLETNRAFSGSLLTLSSMRNCTLKTSGSGNVICGTDNTGGGSSFGTGNVVTIGDSKYVNVGGDTMTGALTINLTSGYLGLKVIQTASGSIFHAEKALTSSGQIIVRQSGISQGSGALTVTNTTRYGTGAYFASSGAILVLDSVGGSPTNPSFPHILFGYKGTFDTSLSRRSAGILETKGAFSGSKLFASKELSSSGVLIVKSLGKTGSGAMTIVPTEFQTGAYLYGSGAPVIALETYTNTGSKTSNIAFGYKGNFDTALYRVGPSNSGALALRVTNSFNNNAASAFEIYSNATHTNNKVFRVATNGATFADGAYASTGADYAEWFMSSDNLLPGEVVCIDVTKKNTVKRCDRDADGNVMGIVSTNPSFVGNSIGGASGIVPPGYELIGLIGQVPANVIIEGSGGTIRAGDSLTAASRPGYARKARAGESTVGVALEPFDAVQGSTGTVNVLISRRNSSMTVDAVGQKVLDTIADMQIEDEVQLMVSSALGDLNVDDQISDEVAKQITTITAQNANIEAIAAEVESLKAELEALKNRPVSATGTTVITQTGSSFDHLTASSLELENTLVTGGDARIGGDLSIDGTLNASSLFVPNGLTIDGGVTMNGILDAEILHAADASVDGILTINGQLLLGSGATIDMGSGALSLRQLVVSDSLFVMGDITIQGLARFLGDIQVHGELTVNANQAGFAVIPATGTSVTVRFGTGFRATPVVTASPDVPVLYGVMHSSATGFTIRLADPATEDVTFSWHALSTGDPVRVRAEVAADGTMIFPLASDNIPVSSNMAWNACIRNIAILDESGQPLSCSRYHDSYTWTHPDLGITFIWNTSLTPPLLQLPDGYETSVTEDAQGILDAINGEDVEDLEDVEEETGTGSEMGDLGSGTTVEEETPPEEELAPEETPAEEPTEETTPEPTPEPSTPIDEPSTEPSVEMSQ